MRGTSATFSPQADCSVVENESYSHNINKPMALIVFFLSQLRQWGQRLRQRRRLAQLDDRLLSDIGLGRGDVERESGKPFWRA